MPAFPVSLKQKIAYIDIDGNLLLQTDEKVNYDELHIANYQGAVDLDGIVAIRKGKGKYGYAKRSGQEIIPALFDEAWDFRNERGLVGKRIGTGAKGCPVHLYGYVDMTGQLAVDYQYINAFPFDEAVALVQLQDKKNPLCQYGSDPKSWLLIDKSGRQVSELRFEWGAEFSEGLAAVKSGGKYGFIDTSGALIITPKYDWATSFKDGLARVALADPAGVSLPDVPGNFIPITPAFHGTFGVIDKSGNYVVEPVNRAPLLHFDNMQFDYHEGLAMLEVNGKYGFMDLAGNIAVQPEYENAWYFSHGLARVNKNGKCGYINQSGEMVIALQFVFGWGYSEGLAAVQLRVSFRDQKTGKKVSRLRWGYIDTLGNMVIPPQFSSASEFHDGLALVWIDDELGYVNREGTVIWTGK